MMMPKANGHKAKLGFPLLIICSLPAFISGTGENVDKVSPLQINNEMTNGGANDTISDNNENTTETSIESHYDERIPKEVDHFFLLIMSIIIFFMQCGFAFMEAGAVRSKNTVNILIKNWLDMCIGALVYWAVGFGLTFGDSPPILSPFMGTSYFFFFKMPAYKLSKWFFQFVFAATAATLVSGSLAERCNFIAYLVYSIMITGFIYPIIAHWTWHKDGWLRINGFHDFAGSAVVHTTGAVCALVGCVLMGPRHGRFDKTDGHPIAMPGHSVPLSALGGLILVFGFFACNGTKRGSITHPGDGLAVATAIVNTALGTSAAGLSTLMFSKTGIVPGTGRNYSFLITMNGSLTGTIALCAGCDVYPAWGSVIVGGFSGPLYVFFNYLLIRCGIDDPLDAIPVHGGGGVFGTLVVYVFKADGGLFTGGFLSKNEHTLNNYPFHALNGLAWNIIGLISIIAWTGITCFIMFSILAKLKMLRVEVEQEFKGMDLLKHGESAYPADAWVEQQYMKEDAIDNGIINGGGCDSGRNESKEPGKVSSTRTGLPPHMSFSRAASYNDPHQMFPSTAKLFSGFNSVAANSFLKPIEPPAIDLETLVEEGVHKEPMNQSESLSTNNRGGVSGESNNALRLRGLSSNGLDGDLVLHKEENHYSKSTSREGQGLSKESSVEDVHYEENACLVNVDPLTKSSTIVTQLSSVQEEEGDVSVNHEIINDDGIVIEEEEIGSTDNKNAHRKTTTITLTSATEAASKANQHKNQEIILSALLPLSSNVNLDHRDSNTKINSEGQNVNQTIYSTHRSSLPMPMVIAAANKARCLQKVPTISVTDAFSDTLISKDINNGRDKSDDKSKNIAGARCSLMKVAVAVVSPSKSSSKSTPKERINTKF